MDKIDKHYDLLVKEILSYPDVTQDFSKRCLPPEILTLLQTCTA